MRYDAVNRVSIEHEVRCVLLQIFQRRVVYSSMCVMKRAVHLAGSVPGDANAFSGVQFKRILVFAVPKCQVSKIVDVQAAPVGQVVSAKESMVLTYPARIAPLFHTLSAEPSGPDAMVRPPALTL